MNAPTPPERCFDPHFSITGAVTDEQVDSFFLELVALAEKYDLSIGGGLRECDADGRPLRPTALELARQALVDAALEAVEKERMNHGLYDAVANYRALLEPAP